MEDQAKKIEVLNSKVDQEIQGLNESLKETFTRQDNAMQSIRNTMEENQKERNKRIDARQQRI